MAEPTSTGSTQNEPATQEAKTLCVVNTIGLPTAVRFQQSITLTQAIEAAGIVRKDVKDQVWIVKKLENSTLTIIKVDLKASEKRRGQDLTLNEHDMVYVLPKKKRQLPEMELIYAACAACGCRVIGGMHGPLMLPQ